jgi:ribosomal protein L1
MIRNFFSTLNFSKRVIHQQAQTANNLYKYQKYQIFSIFSRQSSQSTSEENTILEFPEANTEQVEETQTNEKIYIDGVPVSGEDILRNRYKVIIKKSSVSEDAFNHIDTNSIVKEYSSLFSNWLVERVKEGRGTKFSFDELPQEIQNKLSTLRGVYEAKERFIPIDRSEYSRLYQDKMNDKGFVTEEDLKEIENIKPFIFRAKEVYEDPREAVREIKKYSKEKSLYDSIIKLQLVMNLDFDRQDHFVQTLIKLPHESQVIKDICVITSEENSSQALVLGANAAYTAPRLASMLEEKSFTHKKLLCTEDQYTDLADYCTEGLRKFGIEVPARELGTVLKIDDLQTAIQFIQSGSVNLRPIQTESPFVENAEKFNKIIDIDIGDTSMPDEHLIANLDFVLRKLSEMQPLSIQGRYILSGIFIVRNKDFNIQAKTLDPKYDSYFNRVEEKIKIKPKVNKASKENNETKETKETKAKGKKETKEGAKEGAKPENKDTKDKKKENSGNKENKEKKDKKVTPK